MRRCSLKRGFAGPAAPHTIDDIGAALPHCFKHVWKQFRRILEVGVDDQDCVPATEVETGGQRELVAMIAREVDRDEPGVGFRHPLHRRPAAVARAVVDQHQLKILAHGSLRRRGQPLVQLSKAGFLVEAGDDDRKSSHGCVLYRIDPRPRQTGRISATVSGS